MTPPQRPSAEVQAQCRVRIGHRWGQRTDEFSGGHFDDRVCVDCGAMVRRMRSAALYWPPGDDDDRAAERPPCPAATEEPRA